MVHLFFEYPGCARAGRQRTVAPGSRVIDGHTGKWGSVRLKRGAPVAGAALLSCKGMAALQPSWALSNEEKLIRSTAAFACIAS